jgi:hypothetical protein
MDFARNKEVTEITAKRFAESPLGRAAEHKIFDKPMSEYEKPFETVDKPENVEALHKEYVEDLKAKSEHPETIKDYDPKYEKITPEENAEKRAEFNANKGILIGQWEQTYGREWPRYKEDVYMGGKIIRRAGDRYDAHHAKPLGFGGENTADNITPISAEKHFDKKGVHAPDSPYGRMEKLLRSDTRESD